MISAIIIDDEHNARQTLHNLLGIFCPQINVIGEAEGVTTGLDLINALAVDLVFLDIHMNDGSGFDLLDALKNPSFKIIFTTAYDQFALKAFKYHAINYLLKPINPQQLQDAVAKFEESHQRADVSYHEQLTSLSDAIQSKSFTRITLSTNEGLYILTLQNIIRLYSTGGYTTFFCADQQKITIAKTIKEYEEILPSDVFFRIHRSHIININYIKGILKQDGGYLLTTDGEKLPIARRKKEELILFLKNKSL